MNYITLTASLDLPVTSTWVPVNTLIIILIRGSHISLQLLASMVIMLNKVGVLKNPHDKLSSRFSVSPESGGIGGVDCIFNNPELSTLFIFILLIFSSGSRAPCVNTELDFRWHGNMIFHTFMNNILYSSMFFTVSLPTKQTIYIT